MYQHAINCKRNYKMIKVCCPKHLGDLEGKGNHLVCTFGCEYPLVNNIIRFVKKDNYASSFGLQWKIFCKTQLDSYTGLPISRIRLNRLLGGDGPEILKGKKVLEVGCGAGRFSEVILESGAELHAVDLSEAVEANYRNCCNYPNYHVYQANLLELPFSPGQFDIVICIGVVQHTPDPEKTISSLCSQVRPGGMLVLDHYSQAYSLTYSRRALRAILIRLPSDIAYRISKVIATSLWPFHRLLWKIRNLPVLGKLRFVFLQLSPVVDYHDSYFALGPKLLREWAILDTHDTLTDVYKHLRSAEDIADHLQRCGMVGIQTAYAGNGVEARAWKPSVSTGFGKEDFSEERS